MASTTKSKSSKDRAVAFSQNVEEEGSTPRSSSVGSNPASPSTPTGRGSGSCTVCQVKLGGIMGAKGKPCSQCLLEHCSRHLPGVCRNCTDSRAAELQAAKQEAASALADKQKLSSRLFVEESKVAELEAQLQDSRGRIAQLESERSTLTQQVVALETENSELTKEVDELNKELDEADDVIERMEDIEDRREEHQDDILDAMDAGVSPVADPKVLQSLAVEVTELREALHAAEARHEGEGSSDSAALLERVHKAERKASEAERKLSVMSTGAAVIAATIKPSAMGTEDGTWTPPTVQIPGSPASRSPVIRTDIDTENTPEQYAQAMQNIEANYVQTLKQRLAETESRLAVAETAGKELQTAGSQLGELKAKFVVVDAELKAEFEASSRAGRESAALKQYKLAVDELNTVVDHLVEADIQIKSPTTVGGRPEISIVREMLLDSERRTAVAVAEAKHYQEEAAQVVDLKSQLTEAQERANKAEENLEKVSATGGVPAMLERLELAEKRAFTAETRAVELQKAVAEAKAPVERDPVAEAARLRIQDADRDSPAEKLRQAETDLNELKYRLKVAEDREKAAESRHTTSIESRHQEILQLKEELGEAKQNLSFEQNKVQMESHKHENEKKILGERLAEVEKQAAKAEISELELHKVTSQLNVVKERLEQAETQASQLDAVKLDLHRAKVENVALKEKLDGSELRTSCLDSTLESLHEKEQQNLLLKDRLSDAEKRSSELSSTRLNLARVECELQAAKDTLETAQRQAELGQAAQVASHKMTVQIGVYKESLQAAEKRALQAENRLTELARSESHVEVLKSELQAAESKAAEHEAKVSMLQQMAIQNSVENERLESTARGLDTQLKSNSFDLQRTSSDMRELSSKLASAEQRYLEAETSLASLKGVHVDKMKIEADRDMLLTKLQDAQSKLATAEEQVADKQRAEIESEVYRDRLQELEAKSETAETEVLKLQKVNVEIEVMKERLDEAERRAQAAEGEIQEMRLKSVEQQVLQARLEDSERRGAELQARVAELQAATQTVKALQERLSEADQRARELTDHDGVGLLKAEAEMRAARDRAVSAEKRVATLEAQLSELYVQVTDAERRASGADSALRDCTQMTVIAQAIQAAEHKAGMSEGELAKMEKTAELVMVLRERLREAETRMREAERNVIKMQRMSVEASDLLDQLAAKEDAALQLEKQQQMTVASRGRPAFSPPRTRDPLSSPHSTSISSPATSNLSPPRGSAYRSPRGGEQHPEDSDPEDLRRRFEDAQRRVQAIKSSPALARGGLDLRGEAEAAAVAARPTPRTQRSPRGAGYGPGVASSERSMNSSRAREAKFVPQGGDIISTISRGADDDYGSGGELGGVFEDFEESSISSVVDNPMGMYGSGPHQYVGEEGGGTRIVDSIYVAPSSGSAARDTDEVNTFPMYESGGVERGSGGREAAAGRERRSPRDSAESYEVVGRSGGRSGDYQSGGGWDPAGRRESRSPESYGGAGPLPPEARRASGGSGRGGGYQPEGPGSGGRSSDYQLDGHGSGGCGSGYQPDTYGSVGRSGDYRSGSGWEQPASRRDPRSPEGYERASGGSGRGGGYQPDEHRSAGRSGDYQPDGSGGRGGGHQPDAHGSGSKYHSGGDGADRVLEHSPKVRLDFDNPRHHVAPAGSPRGPSHGSSVAREQGAPGPAGHEQPNGMSSPRGRETVVASPARQAMVSPPPQAVVSPPPQAPPGAPQMHEPTEGAFQRIPIAIPTPSATAALGAGTGDTSSARLIAAAGDILPGTASLAGRGPLGLAGTVQNPLAVGGISPRHLSPRSEHAVTPRVPSGAELAIAKQFEFTTPPSVTPVRTPESHHSALSVNGHADSELERSEKQRARAEARAQASARVNKVRERVFDPLVKEAGRKLTLSPAGSPLQSPRVSPTENVMTFVGFEDPLPPDPRPGSVGSPNWVPASIHSGGATPLVSPLPSPRSRSPLPRTPDVLVRNAGYGWETPEH